VLYSEDLYPLKINGKYGFIDEKGILKIAPSFEYAQPFADDRALIREEGKYGFIDPQGKIVFFVEGVNSWQWIHSFSDGLAAVRINPQEWGFIDKAGNFVIPPQFYNIRDFSEGVAAVRPTLSSEYFYIDKQGHPVFPGQSFKVAEKKKEGYMVVGQQLVPNSRIKGRSEGEQITVSGLGRGVINAKGEIVIPIELGTFDSEVSDGLILSGRGFLDMKNNVAINRYFQKAGRFYNGVIPVSTDGIKYGVINIKGEYILPEIFDGIYTFSSGCAVYEQNNKYGYIDVTGKIIIPAQFDSASSFKGELGFIKKGNAEGYVTKSGRIYLSSAYEIQNSGT
jgi:hypothetical protein